MLTAIVSNMIQPGPAPSFGPVRIINSDRINTVNDPKKLHPDWRAVRYRTPRHQTHPAGAVLRPRAKALKGLLYALVSLYAVGYRQQWRRLHREHHGRHMPSTPPPTRRRDMVEYNGGQRALPDQLSPVGGWVCHREKTRDCATSITVLLLWQTFRDSFGSNLKSWIQPIPAPLDHMGTKNANHQIALSPSIRVLQPRHHTSHEVGPAHLFWLELRNGS